MTRRVVRLLIFVVLLSAWFLISAPLAAQDSPQPDRTTSSTTKPKEAAKTEEAAKEEASTEKTSDTHKTEGKADDEKNAGTAKKKDAPPAVESPKLIEVPQDGTPYTPRPKVVAVFVFTNGNRIETSEYLITRDAVIITKDGRKTQYPINSVDRAATKAANEGRVDIVFPKSKSEFNLDF